MPSTRVAAGRLRHPAAFFSRTEERDEFGGTVDVWSASPYVVRRVSIEPITGIERFNAERVEGEVTHLVRLRHTPGITPRDMIESRGRQFEIVSVINPDERSRSTEIMAKELV